MGRVIRQLQHSWNAFRDAPVDTPHYGGMTMSPRAARSPARYYNDRSILGSIYNRMSVDFSSIEFYHAMLDDSGVAVGMVSDDLNNCLTLDPNIDQSAQAFKQDIAMTMFEHGHVAIVPIDADLNLSTGTAYTIKSMRVGRVVAWRPRQVTVEVYDDREFDSSGVPVNGGIVKQVTMPKNQVAIVENPFYTVMNEPSGLMARLLRKLSIMDAIDEASGSGKLDLIFQLPYNIRSETRRDQAEKRRADLRNQLKDDELGIGYIDVSEKVIQLNRPIENKLLDQIEYLFAQIYTEMGLTAEIMNGTASREAINHYFDRTIEPIANAICLELKRKFLTKTSLSRKHSIEIYRDPLKLIPLEQLAEIVDKLTRSEVATPNEIRPKIGLRPSSDPAANMLRNPNMPMKDQPGGQGVNNDQELPSDRNPVEEGRPAVRDPGDEVGATTY